jgi:hypothetical protein
MKTVKKVVEVSVDENEHGLGSLLGKKVSIMSVVYHYAGTLVEVNGSCVTLEDAGIVFDTGDYKNKKYSDYQKLPTDKVYVQIATIEAFFETTSI